MDGRRKLTDEQIAWIKERVKKGVKQEAIAREFGISPQHVSKIKLKQRHAAHIKQTVGKALDWLLAGKPVTRECWQTNEYLRYSVATMTFELWTGYECDILEAFEISGYDLFIRDWILGEFDADREPIWPEE
jgi:transcriptional regulator with XRE-family HTH domain